MQLVAGLTLEEWTQLPTSFVPVEDLTYDRTSVCAAIVKELLRWPNGRPIWVKRRGDLLVVVDGKHRVECARALDRPVVPAKVA